MLRNHFIKGNLQTLLRSFRLCSDMTSFIFFCQVNLTDEKTVALIGLMCQIELEVLAQKGFRFQMKKKTSVSLVMNVFTLWASGCL